MLIENPKAARTAKGDERHGMAMTGMIVVAALEEDEHDEDHQADRLEQRDHQLLHAGLHEGGLVVGDDRLHAVGEAILRSISAR